MTSSNSRKYGLLLVLTSFLLRITPLHSQCISPISTFPYHESFEGGPAGWTTGGTANDWTLGSPTKPLINAAADGVNCWIIGGPTISFYNLGERSWVQSPCFDFTAVSNPYISLSVFWESEFRYDGGNMQ